MTQTILCGWFLYLAVLAGLMAASAGPRTWLGWLGGLAAGAALARVVVLWRPIAGVTVDRGPLAGIELVALGMEACALAAGLAGLVAGRRQDTRLIALLLAGAAVFPIALYFWRPG